MKKLFNWLNKYGHEYELANYKENYFFNAPPVQFQGVIVKFAKNNRGCLKEMAKVEKYATRYGYAILTEYNSFYHFSLAICKKSDYNAYKLYNEYSSLSANAWEIMQHDYITNGRQDEINTKGREIMEKYEKEYLYALDQEGRKTA